MYKLTKTSRKDGGITQHMDLILLHGLGQNPSSWNEILSFMPQCIKTYCPDLLNLCEDKAYENIYLAFEKYADDFSSPINLCGISFGAVLALNYTLNHADKVSSLVLIAPQYKMPKLLLRFQNSLFRILPNTFFSKDGIEKQDIIQLTNSMMFLDFEQELRNIMCPTLIICGQKDTANMKAAKKMANLISNAQLYFIDKAGHEVNVFASKKLADVMHLFYTK